MKEIFSDVVNFYKEILQETLRNSETQQDFDANIKIAEKILEKSEENLSFFFYIILGQRPDVSNMTSMFFPQRFLKIKLSDEILQRVESVLINCFMIGYIYHFIFMRFPSRGNIESVDYNQLFEEWLLTTLVADLRMTGYNQDQNGLPKKYLEIYYNKTNNYDLFFKNELRVGYFKRMRVFSFMSNIMFCGAEYGIEYDMKTI